MFVRVKLKVQLDNTGNRVEVPGLLTPAGLLTPLLDYFLEETLSHSIAWMEKVVRSVRIFCNYIYANTDQRDPAVLFNNFAAALISGSFDTETFDDSSGLYWHARQSKDVSGILTDLNYFFDWLGKKSPYAASINPKVAANSYEQRCNELAQFYSRKNALLGHLWRSGDDDKKTRRTKIKSTSSANSAEPPAFPENRFNDLINDGFRVGRRIDHRGICITLLMHGAGFRVSEPFHLYVQDVMPDPVNPKSALVRIHHPTDGFAPDRWKAPGQSNVGNRAAYLSSMYGMKPRHVILGNDHAGWKGGFYDADHYKQAYWFEPIYGEWFLYHWNCYIQQLVHIERDHPFLLANLTRGQIGGMYTLPTFNDLHANACRRIGLIPAKRFGTSPHGHRHAYGQRIKKAGFDEKMIQVMLHHASPESQKPYTEPGVKEVNEAIRVADERLHAMNPEASPQFSPKFEQE